ncbi:hypothetical protein WCD93_30750 [Klebsiella michiganensis]|uniref:hypothetical protein n=1 Tax=Klebsiella michiganensis TaxID=1134687 RepID=UPI0034D41A58
MKTKPETEMRKWKRLNQIVSRKRKYRQEDLDKWRKEQEEEERIKEWLDENVGEILRHMTDLFRLT